VPHLLFPAHTPTQVKRCSSVVPFCSAKTYLQGCNKLPSVALAYTVHLPVRLRSSRCSLTAVHLFCFTHSLHPHSQLFHPPKPLLRCSLLSQYFLLGVCRCLLFLLACGSLRADRAVMLFAFCHVPPVASFQSLVPHSFHSATFSTAHKSSSFTTLHELTQSHSAICLQFSFNVFVWQLKSTNTPHAIAVSYCSIPSQQSFRFVQSLPLPLPTLMQKITPALP